MYFGVDAEALVTRYAVQNIVAVESRSMDLKADSLTGADGDSRSRLLVYFIDAVTLDIKIRPEVGRTLSEKILENKRFLKSYPSVFQRELRATQPAWAMALRGPEINSYNNYQGCGWSSAHNPFLRLSPRCDARCSDAAGVASRNGAMSGHARNSLMAYVTGRGPPVASRFTPRLVTCFGALVAGSAFSSLPVPGLAMA
ncbi:hypothetical protein PoB_002554000 [Plakobranchus ocellatus]|uniref:Uncharacterized protein n=1 Tax=Plakobranchus ocellatus TaxID=259542 RepID=A0AAV3ZT86_9GAST|nr:hypothetical protein PoB_002554000 [Plakobranchus ocellatus]